MLDPPPTGWEPAPVTTALPSSRAAEVTVDRALKRERFGWYSYDWAMSVFNTSVTTARRCWTGRPAAGSLRP